MLTESLRVTKDFESKASNKYPDILHASLYCLHSGGNKTEIQMKLKSVETTLGDFITKMKMLSDHLKYLQDSQYQQQKLITALEQDKSDVIKKTGRSKCYHKAIPRRLRWSRKKSNKGKLQNLGKQMDAKEPGTKKDKDAGIPVQSPRKGQTATGAIEEQGILKQKKKHKTWMTRKRKTNTEYKCTS